ncbi:hypothetical protein H0H93_006602 [Arthromyces matolae]|nr:hypothetical protein H0H93_006602 [Arthromyces matolae]
MPELRSGRTTIFPSASSMSSPQDDHIPSSDRSQDRQHPHAPSTRPSPDASASPSQHEGPIDTLPLWKWLDENEKTHQKSDPGYINCPRTLQIWALVKEKVKTEENLSETFAGVHNDVHQKDEIPTNYLAEQVKESPPQLIVFEYTKRDSWSEVDVKSLIIFVAFELVSALEAAPADSDHERCLEYFLFSSLLHELSHWGLRMFDADRRSGKAQARPGFSGKAVGEKEGEGESGYAFELSLFGWVPIMMCQDPKQEDHLIDDSHSNFDPQNVCRINARAVSN